VRVPIAHPVAPAVPFADLVADDLGGRTILVIDDEPAIVDALVDVLERWGCVAVAAGSAREAIALLGGRGLPDAMVVDAQLRDGASGMAAIAEVRAALGGPVPAIIVTGDTDPARIREAAGIGFPLLHKPLSPMRLRAALSSCLDAHAAARARSQRLETLRS
jgi:CheY-like chemotaxis protein